MSATTAWLRPMTGRRPDEEHRTATPLELFFDLVFVVAVASAGAELHHGLAAGHPEDYLGYLITFFAVWWAWNSWTWFSSAYDCDDVVYRLLSFGVMAGALVLAAAVPALFEDAQSGLAVTGYAIMRFAQVGLWLRAAHDDPGHRHTALTYAVGITLVQVFWITRLLIHDEAWLLPTFGVGILLEFAVPLVAERVKGATPFHPHHMAERYGLFTMIVLGEIVLLGAGGAGGAGRRGRARARRGVRRHGRGGCGHGLGGPGGPPAAGAGRSAARVRDVVDLLPP